MAEQGVRFVRIHGRVVPIHDRGQLHKKEKDHEKAKGAGLIAAGVGAALASGEAAARLQRESAHQTNVAGNYKAAWKINKAKADTAFIRNSKARRAAGQFKQMAAKGVIEARRFHMAGERAKKFGIVAGGGLVAAGVHKLLPEKMKKENPKTTKTVATGSGVAAAFGIRSAYYKSKHMGNMKLWDAVKLAAKRVSVRGAKL